MRISCANVTHCTNAITFEKGWKQIGTRLFCSLKCALQWQEQDKKLYLAASNNLDVRRSTPGRKWYHRDNFQGDG